jgi:hypothetical protein
MSGGFGWKVEGRAVRRRYHLVPPYFSTEILQVHQLHARAFHSFGTFCPESARRYRLTSALNRSRLIPKLRLFHFHLNRAEKSTMLQVGMYVFEQMYATS